MLLSVIIPTYNEKHNIIPLTQRLCRCLEGREFEILFVDDSTDRTPQVLEELSRRDGRVRYLHRVNQRGLATAVVEGFRAARGEILAVLDADLQHPPELLPQMLDHILRGYDLVIASRFVPGASDSGLNFQRKLVSLAARLAGRLLLKSLRPVRDPLSGYFMLRREVIEGVPLSPLGWKILAEILVRGRYSRVVEVPFTFQRRLNDRSKMNITEQLNYLRHLWRLLRSSPEDLRFWKFCLVGTCGVAVNFAFFALFTFLLALDVLFSALLASSLAMYANFLLNDAITWNQPKHDHVLVRAAKFYLFSGTGMLLNAAVLSLLHSYWQVPALWANGMGILAATAWNYYANNRWTFTARSFR
ncbi:glycosyltransferase [Desulfovirgula thermocuniculi]|uniref:glycosyltransferase n=1 Tax=Desulfovirgula thermocuniculi TaxID=348842 RepID=UPI0004195242|nr:glycosyltransferase family 2 protein [Desulfovirgula thermocuniculi]